MKTRTSITTISGKDTKVTHTEPTLDEIIEAIGKERAARIIVDDVNRHKFLPACGTAGAVRDGEVEFKQAGTTTRRMTEALEMLKLIESGNVFDILDFIPEGRGGKPTKGDLEVAEQAWTALETKVITADQLSASYAKVGLVYEVQTDKAKFIAMHANKKRVERAQAGKSLA